MLIDSSYEGYKFSDYFKTDLPSHWNEKRLGLLAKEERSAFVDGPFGSDLKSSDYKDAGVPLIQLNNIRDSKHLMQNMKFITEEKKQELIRHLAMPGDVVIAKMAEPVARSAKVASDFPEYVIVADCVKMTPNLNLIDLNYLVWAINSDHVRINAELVSTGTTRIRVNLGALKKLKIPYPPSSEQRTIANFLDYEIAKIDSLIEKQQQLIKLLKEKRQSVISHAVTKGLNPNAPMRDSGVEWLGEVPEHWEVKRLKFGCEFITLKKIIENKKVIALENIESWTGKYIKTDSGYSGEDVEFKTGDILFGKLRPYLAKVYFAEEDGFAFGDLLVYRPKEYLIGKYCFYQMINEAFISTVDSSTYGSKMPRASSEYISNMGLLLPPVEEQKEIVAEIEGKLKVFEDVGVKAESAIKLMQERRTALISAAVTGKIDVRNWQSPEPSINKNNKEVAV